MFGFIHPPKAHTDRYEYKWLDDLDDTSKQDTVIQYLRSLDKTSLNNLYNAVEKFREGDKILGRVKEPKVEEEKDDLEN